MFPASLRTRFSSCQWRRWPLLTPLLLMLLLLLSGGQPSTAFNYIVEPGPEIIATKGAIWPQPLYQTSTDPFLAVRPYSLRFNLSNNTCDILDEAIKRYTGLITSAFNIQRRGAQGQRPANATRLPSSRQDPLFEGTLETFDVNLKSPCEQMPHLQMDESYTLRIQSPTDAGLEAFSVWGALRGLESFSQLLYLTADGRTLRANLTRIEDAPRFAHRGLLVDTARHYMPLGTLRTLLDGMAYTKLNVFHWHIVDDQSFPWESRTHPELSERGAYHATQAVYSQNDTATLIEYARMRGIRVMVELDSPGHTRSWGVSHPELLTQCGDDWEGKLGPMDPSTEVVYEFMEELLGDIAEQFPDRYVHLGGDEVGFKCWRSNANISNYMANNNITTYEALEGHYIQRIVDISTKLRLNSIVWEEVFTNGVRLDPNQTIVHVWMPNMPAKLAEVTAHNLNAIASSCWYLDHLSGGGDWRKYYECDPHNFYGTDEQKARVLGGETCMWSESVNAFNVVQRVFPRACAAAEVLWSSRNATDGNYEEAQHRLEEHTCRMNRRGVAAQPPNNAGYCY